MGAPSSGSTWSCRRPRSITRSSRELRRLDPTGPGNPDPLVAVEGLTVTRVRAANGGHTQLTLRKRLDVVDGIAFGRADLAEAVAEGDRLDVVARVVTRRFGGYESIQLEIRDVAPAGHVGRAGRRRRRDRRRRAAGRRDRFDDPPGGAARAQGAGRERTRTGSARRARSSRRSRPTVGLVVVALVDARPVHRLRSPCPAAARAGGQRRHGGTVAASSPIRTPAPSNVVIVDPRTNIPGTLVYVKQGNLWTQTGNQATQITTSGAGSMPSWSPDGQWIYYIESVHDQGYFPGGAEGPHRYTMDYPVLTRIHPDGSGAEKLLSGRYRQGQYTWFFWIRQPQGVAGRPDGGDRRRTARIRRRATSSSRRTTSRRTRLRKVERAREAAARSPGPGLAARRQAPAVRQERTRRDPRRAR